MMDGRSIWRGGFGVVLAGGLEAIRQRVELKGLEEGQLPSGSSLPASPANSSREQSSS